MLRPFSVEFGCTALPRIGGKWWDRVRLGVSRLLSFLPHAFCVTSHALCLIHETGMFPLRGEACHVGSCHSGGGAWFG